MTAQSGIVALRQAAANVRPVDVELAALLDSAADRITELNNALLTAQHDLRTLQDEITGLGVAK